MSQDDGSIYAILQSTGSESFYPSNTASCFKTQLASNIELPGNWEVGLTEIQYPRTWPILKTNGYLTVIVLRTDRLGMKQIGNHPSNNNVNQYYTERYEIQYKHRISDNVTAASFLYNTIYSSEDVVHVEFPMGNYSSPELIARYLMYDLNLQFKRIANPLVGIDGKIIEQLIDVVFDHIEGKFHIKTYAPGMSLIFYKEDTVGNLLGFPPSQDDTGRFTSHLFRTSTKSVRRPIIYNSPALYVYTDIVEEQHVGQSLVQLLRAIPVTGDHGKVISCRFEKPFYKRVVKGYISSIEILIADDTGLAVDFKSGSVSCTLHLRKIEW